MSLVMSMELGQLATVTDVDGNEIEIDDNLTTIYTLDEDTFDDTWETTDDRVMGGGSYSYSKFENGVGVFYGTAVSEDGGFSMINQYRSEDVVDDEDESGLDMNTIDAKWDLSEYDGFVVDVAA